ncbi:MAG TPA: response regulator transcription factor [Ktedonobacteraceae bacterium]|jgi:DNA-binding NarL/FixJ family response regulator|nr:response regulator transcription factor [Ktedonobacteraceae bacterium]
MKECIRVLIVDDQTLVREGLRRLLEFEPDFAVVDTADSGETALMAVERLSAEGTLPDVILMDIRMPQMDGIAATRVLRERWPGIHIVMLTTFDDTELVHAGLYAGALGYALKNITAGELAQTVRAAARGQTLLQPEIAGKVFSALMPSSHESSTSSSSSVTGSFDAAAPIERLTGREREILALLAQGATNRQIAERLYLREGTVKNHISSILGKLGVHDRTQAALKAREPGSGLKQDG